MATEKKTAYGMLSKYANPALWEQESGAFEEAMMEKAEVGAGFPGPPHTERIKAGVPPAFKKEGDFSL